MEKFIPVELWHRTHDEVMFKLNDVVFTFKGDTYKLGCLLWDAIDEEKD